MHTWKDVGGCDAWLRPILNRDMVYDIYHASKKNWDKTIPTRPGTTWTYAGRADWLTYGVPNAQPKAKAKAVAEPTGDELLAACHRRRELWRAERGLPPPKANNPNVPGPRPKAKAKAKVRGNRRKS
jgi:hypothetical protein